MKIHHIRNATFVIETGDIHILVDPMLGKKGSMPPFTFFRFKARRNPMVNLPDNYETILEKVTRCIITHQHPDHIDNAAKRFLKDRNIPIICSMKDAKTFRKDQLNVTLELKYWSKESFLGGTITGIPARHGYGFIAKPMSNVMGFYLDLPNTPSIYISADTIYTDDVEKVLEDLKPEVTVMAAGSAQFDIGQPLLMHLDDIVKFVKKSPGKVYANHLEALNHCPTTRQLLKSKLSENGLLKKVSIPEDGETILISP